MTMSIDNVDSGESHLQLFCYNRMIPFVYVYGGRIVSKKCFVQENENEEINFSISYEVDEKQPECYMRDLEQSIFKCLKMSQGRIQNFFEGGFTI